MKGGCGFRIEVDENPRTRMNKPKMFLFTDGFPYGNGETFIENEIPLLTERFDLTLVAATDIKECYRIYKTVNVVKIEKPLANRIELLISLAEIIMNKKLRRLFIKDVKTGNSFIGSVKLSLNSFARSKKLYKRIVQQGIIDQDDKALLYFYWNTYKPVYFLIHKNSWKIVSRIHGYDLEIYDTPINWQVWKGLNRNIDKLYFISKNGQHYYSEMFDKNVDCYSSIARLGIVNNYGFVKNSTNSNKSLYTLVSCSRVVKCKRIDILIDALAKIKQYNIRWIHIGDGDLLNYMKDYAQNKLSIKRNITYEFTGFIRNKDIIPMYIDLCPDVFLLTSEAEGAPVSIMEALSCGIPIVSTDVGGISEMLSGTQNILVKEYDDVSQISNAIETMLSYSSDAIERIRAENVDIWNERYNAESNYRQFTSELLDIYNS